jgi:carbonic anhydrase
VKHLSAALAAALSAVLFAAPALAQTPVAPPPAPHWNHDPAAAAAEGPAHWGTIYQPYATCGGDAGGGFFEVGKKQSPVDIGGAQVAALPAPRFLYGTTPFAVDNTGHVVEVPYAPGSQLVIGDDTYDLIQFHFHAPSEHTVNGRPAVAELHLVHRNAQTLNLAVVGVLIEVGAPGTRPNAQLDAILQAAPLEEGKVEVEGQTISAAALLPRNAASFWTYSGSLTTPPCSEGVKWTVLKNPIQISQASLKRFRDIIAGFPGYETAPVNNRPTRPLNGRVILSN